MQKSENWLLMMLTVFVCLCLFHLVFCEEVPSLPEVLPLPDEHDLLLKLFDNQSYDSSVRPVYNSSKNVEVTFGFTLIQIMDMVRKEMFSVSPKGGLYFRIAKTQLFCGLMPSSISLYVVAVNFVGSTYVTAKKNKKKKKQKKTKKKKR